MKRILIVALLVFTGCANNLQRTYVDSMEATRTAIERDVTDGFYKPDATGRRTLDQWKKANADADAALDYAESH